MEFFFLHRPYLPKDNSNFTNFFTFSSVTNQSLHLHKNERTAITLKYQFTMNKISSKCGKKISNIFFEKSTNFQFLFWFYIFEWGRRKSPKNCHLSNKFCSLWHAVLLLVLSAIVILVNLPPSFTFTCNCPTLKNTTFFLSKKINRLNSALLWK